MEYFNKTHKEKNNCSDATSTMRLGNWLTHRQLHPIFKTDALNIWFVHYDSVAQRSEFKEHLLKTL